MKSDKFYLNLSNDEHRKVIQALINLKNQLIQEGKYTDAVDELICKMVKAKTKKFKIIDKR